MKLILEAAAKEIADLVVALQDRQEKRTTGHGGADSISQCEAALRQALADKQWNPDREHSTLITLEIPAELKEIMKAQRR